MQIPEFTCLCPTTGQPDFATLELEYVPDRLCVELKSLKLYIWSFRDRGAFHEAVTNEIADTLAAPHAAALPAPDARASTSAAGSIPPWSRSAASRLAARPAVALPADRPGTRRRLPGCRGKSRRGGPVFGAKGTRANTCTRAGAPV